jgi:hypothetical protein
MRIKRLHIVLFYSSTMTKLIRLRMRLIMITGRDTGTSRGGNDDTVVYF